ncbi:MAG TPA: carbamoyltransferase C-terminal domain-containing protein [Blastocatellia bacterium]|nr:carbamoyltransferase C-terminal domain-containing protein [Blastocatellia bacterium]
MLVIGFSGGRDMINENRYSINPLYWHDAAAVLVEDGKVVFAIEEERLNRIKHTNKLPVRAIRACLESRGAQLRDVDLFAYYEMYTEWWLKRSVLDSPQQPPIIKADAFLRECFRRGFGEDIDPGKFRFVHHHYSHAVSAFALSGYERGLTITLDGEGDGWSGAVFQVDRDEYKRLSSQSGNHSLGGYYQEMIAFLGYSRFDEYKVMGLAPYGDPERFRAVFRNFYTLLPNGQYQIADTDQLLALYDFMTPRRRGEAFTQQHKDIAAALQESLEEIAFHIIRHFKEVTQEKNLCLAGGVAHNCTLNGKVLRSGLFDNVFVQPAAHDAGCALGAALFTYYKAGGERQAPRQMTDVYWGGDIGGAGQIRETLAKWRKFIQFSREDDIVERTAELLAAGRVIGWVQGRSEFGPRALGNRSILADPRPAENKDRINQLVKKREGYRPFAPSVLEEEAETYFDLRMGSEQHAFMIFVVDVKRDKRELLGAVTHVDGTARIQTVSRSSNERLWGLIKAFGNRTGVPLLLNTSFNNNVEPIVDSVEDAIVCYLTTGLDYLVAGDYLARRKEISWDDYLSLGIELPRHVSLHQVTEADEEGRLKSAFSLRTSYDVSRHEVSPVIADIIASANSAGPVKEILGDLGLSEPEEAREIVDGLLDLWSRRLIILKPL